MARNKLSDKDIPTRETLTRGKGLVGSRAERREMRIAVDRKRNGRPMTKRQNELAKVWLEANKG